MLNLNELKEISYGELLKLTRRLNITADENFSKRELLYHMIKIEADREDSCVYGQGFMEILPDGYGFLRSPENNYLAGPDDIYVSPSQIKHLALRKGDLVAGQIRSPKNNERYFAMLKIMTVNGENPDVIKNITSFDKLTPLYPEERLVLEHKVSDPSTRIMDLLTPIGLGHRFLIV